MAAAKKTSRIATRSTGEKRQPYCVTIRATVTKTIVVTAKDEDEAAQLAHAEFTVACDGDEEDYGECSRD